MKKKIKRKIKRKIIGGVLVTAIVVGVVAGLFVPGAISKIRKEDVITSSQLEKVININELSTAEFIYNGIADKYLSLIHISEPTRPLSTSRMPSSA